MAEKENTQALVLQQPNGQKVYLDLNHSTDTTAIWSFLAAALFSTVVAIWFGVRSLKLTQQSFYTVIAQIKSSEQSALDLNKKIFEHQKELQTKELSFREKQEWNNKIIDRGESFLVVRFSFILMYWRFLKDHHIDSLKRNPIPNQKDLEKIKKLDFLLKDTLSKNHILLFNLKSGKSYLRVEKLGTLFMRLGWACSEQCLHLVSHNEFINNTKTLSDIYDFMQKDDLFRDDELLTLKKCSSSEYQLKVNYYDLLVEISSLIDKELKYILCDNEKAT